MISLGGMVFRSVAPSARRWNIGDDDRLPWLETFSTDDRALWLQQSPSDPCEGTNDKPRPIALDESSSDSGADKTPKERLRKRVHAA